MLTFALPRQRVDSLSQCVGELNVIIVVV